MEFVVVVFVAFIAFVAFIIFIMLFNNNSNGFSYFDDINYIHTMAINISYFVSENCYDLII